MADRLPLPQYRVTAYISAVLAAARQGRADAMRHYLAPAGAGALRLLVQALISRLKRPIARI